MRILPSDGDDIYCSITNESLDAQDDRYVCISYTWGSTVGDNFIYLNGHRFPVRETAYALLQSLYVHRINDPFWIDSICIDQTSIAEKNHQVAIMADIYSRAACVLAWLGESADDSDWLFEFLNNIQYPVKVDQIFRGDSFRFLLALERFTKRVYWSRIWIVQELVLAREVELICGASNLAWQRVEQLFQLIPAQKMEGVWLFSPQLTTLCQVLDARKGADSFMQLFNKFGSKDCSIRHDKIYALLGMNRRLANLTKRIPVDYSLSVVDVLYRIIINWEILEPKNTSTSLDFACSFLENVTLNAEEWQSAEHARKPIGFRLGEPTLTWLKWFGDGVETQDLHENSRSLFHQQQGDSSNSRLCASLSGSGKPQRGDTYFRLTTEYPFHSLVLHSHPSDQLSTAPEPTCAPPPDHWNLSFPAWEDCAEIESSNMLSRA